MAFAVRASVRVLAFLPISRHSAKHLLYWLKKVLIYCHAQSFAAQSVVFAVRSHRSAQSTRERCEIWLQHFDRFKVRLDRIGAMLAGFQAIRINRE